MRFVNAVNQYMQTNHGLTFEGFLSKFNIPNYPYIERYSIEEICHKLNLYFNLEEISQIINALDDDRMGKVKTSSLRAKVEPSVYGGMGSGMHGAKDDYYLNPIR